MIRSAMGHFGLAASLLLGAFLMLAVGQRAGDRTDFQKDRAITIARSVAWVAAREAASDDPSAAGQTQRYASALTKTVGVERVLVLKGTRYMAHSDPALEGKGLNRESLADKALYDQSQRLKNTLRKNAEAKERDSSLVRNAYSEVELEPDSSGRLLAVAAPVRLRGAFEAMVDVRVAPAPVPSPLPWGLLVYTLLGLIGFGVYAFFVPKNSARDAAIGAAVLGALAFAHVRTLLDWHTEARVVQAKHRAQLMGQLSASGLFSGPLVAAEEGRDPVPPNAMDELRLSPFGERMGDISVVSSATVAAPDESARRIEVGPTAVYFRTRWFEEGLSRDQEQLTTWGVVLAGLSMLVFVFGVFDFSRRVAMGFVDHRTAYAYLSPAMIGMLVLVFVPVVFGIVLGFMERRYNVFEFAGIDNYISILSDTDFRNPQSFYFKLAVTVMWTVTNVFLHVTIGLLLALLLNDSMLKARGVYRVLLIVPWAIPNYITALIWKGMFHRQFGAINFLLDALGFEPVAWFQTFWPSFLTNLSTNTWLGFPFMMVVSLGSLQSIPADLYEAAEVDGSTRWQRFRYITLPLLKPALVPAIIVGTVWTFNMFNIIYLVSGGAPNGATDILITDAFRWAFERDRYGYAAAYSTIIFLLLLVFTLVTNKATKATQGAFE